MTTDAAGARVDGVRGQRLLHLRIWHDLLLATAAVLVLFPLAVGLYGFTIRHAIDWTVCREATLSWLAGGPFYRPDEVAGPYLKPDDAMFYPPFAIVLFLAFAFLPPVAWVLTPIAITAWALWRLRPRPLAWFAIGVCLNAAPTSIVIAIGNPTIWAVAGVALATRWRPLAVLIFLKPTLFPFAFWGANRRSWWVAAGALALVGVAFLPLWPQWFAVLLNARGPQASLLYSLDVVPLMLIPLIAWFGRRPPRPPGS